MCSCFATLVRGYGDRGRSFTCRLTAVTMSKEGFPHCVAWAMFGEAPMRYYILRYYHVIAVSERDAAHP